MPTKTSARKTSAAQTTTAAYARGRYLRVSPYKVRQVLTLIRGLPVDDAERVLHLCEKDAADVVVKLLNSALANAEHNHSIDPEELFVARAWADEGPTRKWGQPRARGRYFRIRKRTSHVTIQLARFDVDELEERRRRDESSGRGAAVAQRRRAERVRRSRQVEADDAEESAPEEAPDDEIEEHVETAGVETGKVETGEVETGEVDDAAAAGNEAAAADDSSEDEEK